jgi:hypothetical protein
MLSLSKTILCKFYLNGKCKFMNKPDMCLFAHGEGDLIKIECKYKQYCNNIKCNYNHEVSDYAPTEFIYKPIIKTICKNNIKNNKINDKKIIVSINSKNHIQVLKSSVFNKFKSIVNIIILNIKIKKFLKNKKIESIKNVNNDDTCNECYNYKYKIKKQNDFIHNNKIKDIYIILKKYNLNKNLENLELILNQYFNGLNKNKEKDNGLEIKNKFKTISSFEKYYILGKKINENLNNWKSAIKNDVNFINEKNIYKVKTRSLRILNLINLKYKSINIYKNSLDNIPIRNIFNMNNRVFMNYINM